MLRIWSFRRATLNFHRAAEGLQSSAVSPWAPQSSLSYHRRLIVFPVLIQIHSLELSSTYAQVRYAQKVLSEAFFEPGQVKFWYTDVNKRPHFLDASASTRDKEWVDAQEARRAERRGAARATELAGAAGAAATSGSRAAANKDFELHPFPASPFEEVQPSVSPFDYKHYFRFKYRQAEGPYRFFEHVHLVIRPADGRDPPASDRPEELGRRQRASSDAGSGESDVDEDEEGGFFSEKYCRVEDSITFSVAGEPLLNYAVAFVLQWILRTRYRYFRDEYDGVFIGEQCIAIAPALQSV